MPSAKQLAANRANAQRSTGPRSTAGRRRAALNALRHGLSSAIESSPLAIHLPQLQRWLVDEGCPAGPARELALRILDFERNLAHLRKTLIQSGPMLGALPRAAMPGGWDAQLAQRTHALLEDPTVTGTQKLLRATARFARFHDKMSRLELEALELRLRRADRHFRRSANQLVKGLQQIKPD